MYPLRMLSPEHCVLHLRIGFQRRNRHPGSFLRIASLSEIKFETAGVSRILMKYTFPCRDAGRGWGCRYCALPITKSVGPIHDRRVPSFVTKPRNSHAIFPIAHGSKKTATYGDEMRFMPQISVVDVEKIRDLMMTPSSMSPPTSYEETPPLDHKGMFPRRTTPSDPGERIAQDMGASDLNSS